MYLFILVWSLCGCSTWSNSDMAAFLFLQEAPTCHGQETPVLYMLLSLTCAQRGRLVQGEAQISPLAYLPCKHPNSSIPICVNEKYSGFVCQCSSLTVQLRSCPSVVAGQMKCGGSEICFHSYNLTEWDRGCQRFIRVNVRKLCDMMGWNQRKNWAVALFCLLFV